MNLLKHLLGLRRLPFVRDVLTIQAGSFLFMFASFFASVAFARFLGKDSYGTYAVVLAFTATVTTFFNIGQGQSLYVFFAEAFGKKDRDAMSAVLANFLMIATANMALLLLVAWWMPLLSTKLYGDSSIGYLAQLLCIFQISEIWNGMTNILLQSVRRIRFKVILEQSANLSYLGCAIIVLFLGGGVRDVILTQLVVSLAFLPASLFALAYIAKKDRLPGIREVLRVPFKTSRQYLVQGLLMSAEKTIYNFFPQGIFFILSLFSPASTIGILRIAVQLANIPRSVLLPQAGDLSTVAFAKMKQQGVQAIRMNAAKLIKHALAFHTLLSLGAAFLYPLVIHYFYGWEYQEALSITWWLLLILLVSSLHITSSPLVRLYRKTWLSILIGLLNWLCTIAGLLLFVRIVEPKTAFLFAYAIWQITPLLLLLYVFTILLKKPPSDEYIIKTTLI